MSVFSVPEFIKKLDRYYAHEDLSGAEKFLREQYDICNSTENNGGKLTVLNEMTGFFRQTGDKDSAFGAISEALELLDNTDIEDEVTCATIRLNCATTMKCFGKSDEAMKYYDSAASVYEKRLGKNHPLLAGLYNNRGLALQDLGNDALAESDFRRAIEITLTDKKNGLETAVSYVNLAHLLFNINPVDTEINDLLDKAYVILTDPYYFGFDKYAFTCRKCAPSFGYFGRFLQEKKLNERADEVYAGA